MEEQLHLLTGAYALNALNDVERAAFERHARNNPETLEEVRTLSATAALLAYDTDEQAPPPEMKTNIMAAIANTRQLPATNVIHDAGLLQKQSGTRTSHASGSRSGRNSTVRPRWVPVLAAAAALIVFAGVGLGGWALGHSQVPESSTQAGEQTQQQALLTILGEADAKIATTKISTGSVVTIATSVQANQAAIVLNGMPPAPAGKSYELWFISGKGAIPAGLIKTTAANNTVQLLKGKLGDATHIGITVEPLAGSPQPTTTPILLHAI